MRNEPPISSTIVKDKCCNQAQNRLKWNMQEINSKWRRREKNPGKEMEIANVRTFNTEIARVNERTSEIQRNRFELNRTAQKLIVWWNLYHILAMCVELYIEGQCSCWRQIKTQIEKRAVELKRRRRRRSKKTAIERLAIFGDIKSTMDLYVEFGIGSAPRSLHSWLRFFATNKLSLNQLVLSHRIFTRCGWVIVRQASRRRHCRRHFVQKLPLL